MAHLVGDNAFGRCNNTPCERRDTSIGLVNLRAVAYVSLECLTLHSESSAVAYFIVVFFLGGRYLQFLGRHLPFFIPLEDCMIPSRGDTTPSEGGIMTGERQDNFRGRQH